MFSQCLSRLARPEGMPPLLVFLMLLFLFQDAARAAVGYTTPAAGSSERTIILDVVRRKVRELYEIDVVFVVEDLRVKKGWAWIRTRPQTADGTGRYEEFSALLKKEGKTYRIVAAVSRSIGSRTEAISPRRSASSRSFSKRLV